MNSDNSQTQEHLRKQGFHVSMQLRRIFEANGWENDRETIESLSKASGLTVEMIRQIIHGRKLPEDLVPLIKLANSLDKTLLLRYITTSPSEKKKEVFCEFFPTDNEARILDRLVTSFRALRAKLQAKSDAVIEPFCVESGRNIPQLRTIFKIAAGLRLVPQLFLRDKKGPKAH